MFAGVPVSVDVPIPTVKGAYVESSERTDVYEQDFVVTIVRRPDFAYQFNQVVRRSGWFSESDAPSEPAEPPTVTTEGPIASPT